MKTNQTEIVTFEGETGAIDCAIDWPASNPIGWGLVLHPNPAQGGTRDNKVVTTIARACVQRGLLPCAQTSGASVPRRGRLTRSR